jgi:hypothetical protein
MTEAQPFAVGFPLGGLNKATAFALQEQQTTPSQLNVWPIHWSTGRSTGGVRPGLVSSGGSPAGTPLNWIEASWQGGVGVVVTTTSGSYVTTNGSTWNQRIGAPGSTLASSAVMNNILYQASAASSTVKFYNLVTAASGDLTVGTYDDATPKGIVPDNCGLVYVHGGRLILAADAGDSHIVYMSRANDPADWDFAQTDEGAAWASSGESGKIREQVTSLFNHGNQCLLIGGPDSTHVIRGDMRQGGIIDRFHPSVGPLMQSAICKIGSGHSVFMARNGLYGIPPGCVDSIELLTSAIPNDLMGIDPGAGDWVSVCYDTRYEGVHVYVDYNSGTDAAYFFDLKHKGWHPMSFVSGTKRLGVNLRKDLTNTQSALIALGTSGTAHQFKSDDDTESIDASVFIPIAMGSPHMEGMFTELSAVLASASGTVNYRVYTGFSAEEAFNSTPIFTGSWDRAGLNFKSHPRLRYVAAYVEVYTAGTTRWALEELLGITYPVASRRVGTDA